MAWQMLESLNHICGPSVCLLQYVHAFFVLGSPDLDPTLQMSLTSAKLWGRITTLDLLTVLFLTQNRIKLAFFVERTHCPPGPSVKSFFAAGQLLAYSGTWGYSPLRVRTLRFPLLNFHDSPICPFPNPVKVLLNGNKNIWCIVLFSWFFIMCKLS